MQIAHSAHPQPGIQTQEQEAGANCIFRKTLGDLGVGHACSLLACL